METSIAMKCTVDNSRPINHEITCLISVKYGQKNTILAGLSDI